MTRFDPVSKEIEISGTMAEAGVNAISSEPYENRQRMVVDILVGALASAGFKPVAEGTVLRPWAGRGPEPKMNFDLWND